jgi:flagella basal body P-ring formation protein FlgA
MAAMLLAVLAAPGQAAAAAIQPTRDIAAAAATAALDIAQGDGSVTVRETRVDSRLRVPQCAGPLDARAAQGTRAGGRLTIEVGCKAPRWRVYVPVTLAAIRPVVVAAKPLPARKSLAEGDLRMAERDVHALPGGYFSRPEELAGMDLTRALGAGEALTPGVVRAGSLVRRGQQVTLLAEGNGVAVRMKGEALGDGGLRQRIRVRNLSSGREIEGVVRSADLVEVTM